MVFHSLHELHFPTHFGNCAPQFWQKKVVLVLAIQGNYSGIIQTFSGSGSSRQKRHM